MSIDLRKIVENITFENRKEYIMRFQETELHKHLKVLFERMEPRFFVAITHGSSELGKDLVLIKEDNISTETIAIVVKKGDISGNSAGNADELTEIVENIFNAKSKKVFNDISSQIKQSFIHDAEVKEIFERIKINKVFLYIFGTFSNQARTRLDKELIEKYRNIVEVFPIKLIVDKFTEFYPEFFLKGRIHDYLKNKIESLQKNSVVLYGKKNNLEDIYVPALVSKDEIPNIENEADLEKFMKKSIKRKTKISLQNIDKIFESKRKVLLVGDPGSGKSFALTKMALDQLNFTHAKIIEEHEDKFNLPVIVHAKCIYSIENTDSLIKEYFEGYESIIDDVSVNYLLVDGLDEMSQEKREEVLEKSSKIADELKCKLIVTSRKSAFVEERINMKFEKYEILPFEYNQMIKFLQKTLAGDNEKLEAIKNGISQIKMPYYPLTLSLIVKLIEEFNEIPASITELFTRYFEISLGKEDEKKGVSVLWDYDIKRKFLSKLSFIEMMSKNRDSITKEELVEICEDYKREIPSNHSKDMNVFIQEIERTGILKIGKNVKFGHRSFMEYFSSYYIFDNQAEIDDLNDKLCDVYYDENWGDALFYYFGLKKKVSDKVIDILFRKNGEGFVECFQKYTIPRLFLAGISTDEKVKIETIKKSSDFSIKIRNMLLNIFKSDLNTSSFFADIFLLNYSIYSFSSSFIKEEVLEVINQMMKNVNKETPYKIFYLLAGIEERLESSEKEDVILKLMNLMGEIEGFPKKEETQILMFLEKIEKGSNLSVSAATQKLNKMRRRNKELFKSILVPQKIKKLS